MNKYDWVEKRSFCQVKTLEWAHIFQSYFRFKSIAPIDEAFIGQMYSIPIETEDVAGLKTLLYERFQIEVPVFTSNSQVFIRFSYQVFNSDQDMQRLFDAMKTLKEEGYFKIETFE